MKSQIKPYSIRNATLKNFEAKHTKAHATDSKCIAIHYQIEASFSSARKSHFHALRKLVLVTLINHERFPLKATKPCHDY
ncbi:hypothetical protein T4B_11969 [Trichinella pseudospiralis]|uniref:Uncharacterized protein n=1 Tax=Trichinella pseudospiralis TaxID=6337 RepID=A0A0V1GV00_TRIPS|nr:hypothetical protein T4B_11969 [Trichinella pseudospiralis]